MNNKTYADGLREIALRDDTQEQIEMLINACVNGFLAGIKALSLEVAKEGKRNLRGYYDSYYSEGFDYFVRPAMSRTGYQSHTLPGSYPRPIYSGSHPPKNGGKQYSKAQIAYIHQEIVNRLASKLTECGFSKVFLRVDHIAQTNGKKFFPRKTGATLYYLWMDIYW